MPNQLFLITKDGRQIPVEADDVRAIYEPIVGPDGTPIRGANFLSFHNLELPGRVALYPEEISGMEIRPIREK